MSITNVEDGPQWIRIDFGNGEFEMHREDRVLQWGIAEETLEDDD